MEKHRNKQDKQGRRRGARFVARNQFLQRRKIGRKRKREANLVSRRIPVPADRRTEIRSLELRSESEKWGSSLYIYVLLNELRIFFLSFFLSNPGRLVSFVIHF